MTYRKFKYLGGLKSALDLTIGRVYEVDKMEGRPLFFIVDDWLVQKYGDIEGVNKNGRGLKMQILAKDLLNEKYFVEVESKMGKLVELVASVEQWSKDKGLDKSDSSKQFLKVVEEVGEVASALARGDKFKLVDGIGDVIVTLIILAQQNDLTLEECLECAYDEIKGRNGKMIDGVFVKSEDLKND